MVFSEMTSLVYSTGKSAFVLFHVYVPCSTVHSIVVVMYLLYLLRCVKRTYKHVWRGPESWKLYSEVVVICI